MAVKRVAVAESNVVGIWSNSNCVFAAVPKPAPSTVTISPTETGPPCRLAPFSTLSNRTLGMSDMSYSETNASKKDVGRSYAPLNVLPEIMARPLESKLADMRVSWNISERLRGSAEIVHHAGQWIRACQFDGQGIDEPNAQALGGVAWRKNSAGSGKENVVARGARDELGALICLA